MRPRVPRTALAVATGAALFMVSFFSPVASKVVQHVAPPVSPAMEADRVPEPASVRMLGYDNSTDRLRGMRSWAVEKRRLPAGSRLQYVMGSSEFSVPLRQNPNTFLPNRVTDFDFFETGRAFTDIFPHTVELAALPEAQRPRSVVLLVSPQWFGDRVGIRNAFNTGFSDQQWNAMLRNPSVPDGVRASLVSRGQYMMADGPWKDAEPTAGAQGVLDRAFKPLSAFSRHAGLLKVLARERPYLDAYRKPHAVAPGAVPIASLDWDAERRQADSEAEADSSSNRFGIEDQIYRERYADKVEQLRGSMGKDDFSRNSQEWGDLQLFLNVAKARKVRVLLVALPMNGAWYDYSGYPRQRRELYYQRLRQVAHRNHVQLADLSVHEYTPHYFYDGLHPGWEGWLDVIETCYRFSTAGRP